MRISALALIIVLPLSVSAFAYNPAQLTQFEKTGSCPGCDLTSATISAQNDVQTPYNLQGANISNSVYQIANNTGSNFSGLIGINTTFTFTFASTFSQANFENAKLMDASFVNSNLTNANFTGANVSGANFTGANLYGATGFDASEAGSVCNAILPDGSTGQCNN